MFSIPQLLIVLVIALLLFGSGRISGVMGDIGKGIKNFRKNIKDEKDQESKKIVNKKGKK
ncbi:MAG: sec-independent protein translocase protein TatA [Rickettsiales bacterium]|jgi:sec-independent protein translocase protein TatA